MADRKRRAATNFDIDSGSVRRCPYPRKWRLAITLRFISLRDQKAIVLYLHMRGMVLDAIHEDLMRVLGANATAYSTATN
jgi:hypothetical protein